MGTHSTATARLPRAASAGTRLAGTRAGLSALPVGVKLAVTAAAIGSVAATTGLGTFGSWTGTTSAGETLSSGTVSIALGAAGTAANRLTVGASGLVPGDSVQRAVNLTNTGSAFASLSLTTTASPTSLLDTDLTNGLQFVVDECSVPWTEAGTAPAYTYTCSGTTTSRIASRAIIGANLALGALNALSASGVDYLRVTVSLPSVSTNVTQGLTSTVSFAFTGVQRAGGAA